jgi:hypothetical protein
MTEILPEIGIKRGKNQQTMRSILKQPASEGHWLKTKKGWGFFPHPFAKGLSLDITSPQSP